MTTSEPRMVCTRCCSMMHSISWIHYMVWSCRKLCISVLYTAYLPSIPCVLHTTPHPSIQVWHSIHVVYYKRVHRSSLYIAQAGKLVVAPWTSNIVQVHMPSLDQLRKQYRPCLILLVYWSWWKSRKLYTVYGKVKKKFAVHDSYLDNVHHLLWWKLLVYSQSSICQLLHPMMQHGDFKGMNFTRNAAFMMPKIG